MPAFCPCPCPSPIPCTFLSPTPLTSRHPASIHTARTARTRRTAVNTTRCTTPPPGDVRDLSLITVRMTSGGDVLFPGATQQVTLSGDAAMKLLEDVCESDPPEFGHLSINAWGDPASIGTLAVVENVTLAGGDANLLCTGLKRFNVLHLAEDHASARVEMFHDVMPDCEEANRIEMLEKQLVDAMTEIVRLSIKLSDNADETKQQLLQQTLKKVEAFYSPENTDASQSEDSTILKHWLLKLEPHRRREVLSFIVIDLLSISFMDRKKIMSSTDTAYRLREALTCLEPFVKDLAAKGAIVSALGRNLDIGGGDT